MPHVKATIEGREYTFAPLLLHENRSLHKLLLEHESATVFTGIDLWMPYIKSSLSRGGNQDPPDIDNMEVDVASHVFAELVRGVMSACGVEMKPLGESAPVPPTATSGTTSTPSS